MTQWWPFAVAAGLAAATAGWWYGRREERVPGRGAAAALRGGAIFLVLAALWLPSLGDRGGTVPRVAILVDYSRSMRYPVSANGGTSRMQAAREAAVVLYGERKSAELWTFARFAAPIEVADLEGLEATGNASHVLEAIDQARAAGADSLIVVTDGELADREAARRLAERLGVAVAEVVVAEPVARVGIRRVLSPRMVMAGDTFEVRAEITSTGGSGDSARVTLDFGDSVRETNAIALPAVGLSSDASFRVPAGSVGDTTEWKPLVVRVEGIDPPWDAAARWRTFVGVSGEPTGAVIVSLDPDWETRYLLPVLERSVPGGARAFLRVGNGTYIQAGVRPRGPIREAAVRRAAEAATLLVVQGDPGNLPDWVEAASRRSPAVMHLVKGTGPVPGTGVSVEQVLPGEWYADLPPPPGPVSAHLLGGAAEDLPPLTRLYGGAGETEGSVLSARRDRRGAGRPVAVIGSTAGRRWAVVHGEGAWRWAARPGRGLSLYRGLFAGMTGWLVERSAPEPVHLVNPAARAGDSVRWRAAADVRDLLVRLEDGSGSVVWSGNGPDSSGALAGPPLDRGDARFTATGSVRDVPFRIARPFHVNAESEALPRVPGPALDVRPRQVGKDPAERGSEPPVWPFAAAVVLLCAEWLWRRRIGLRMTRGVFE